MMFRLKCLVLWVLLMPAAAADYPVSLESILDDLTASFTIIDEAQRNADRQERFRFEYQDLRADLVTVKQGLRAALQGAEQGSFLPRALFVQYGYAGKRTESRFLLLLIQELNRLHDDCLRLEAMESESGTNRRVDFNFIASDLSAVVDAIRIAIAGAGERPRRFLSGSGEY